MLKLLSSPRLCFIKVLSLELNVFYNVSWMDCWEGGCSPGWPQVLWLVSFLLVSVYFPFEPAWDYKLILQTRTRSHPVGLDVWLFVGPFVYFYTSCVRTVKALSTARMRRLACAFAGRLFDKYHNLMSWLIWLYVWDMELDCLISWSLPFHVYFAHIMKTLRFLIACNNFDILLTFSSPLSI